MADLDVDVEVKVDGVENLDKAGAGIDELEKKSSGFGSVATGVFQGVGQAVAGFGIGIAQAGIGAAIDAIGDSINLASDRAEAASKNQVLFGDSYDLIADKAATAATDVGVSSGKYLELTGTVGNLITNFGFAGDEAAGMSTDIVQLAADVGSFNNAPTADVVEAIGAAFRGETEPIRKFGVMLDDATIKSKAMELGLYDGVGALDANAKATATYQLILEKTSAAQGDFARTSDGLANSQKIANARVEESLTNLGDKLMPIVTAALPLFADGITAVIDVASGLADVIFDVVDAAQPFIDVVVGLYRDYLSALFDVLGDIADQLSGPVNAALDLIRGTFELVAKAVGFFVDALRLAGDTLSDVHHFIDPNAAALDELQVQFRAAGEAAGLSADEVDQAWRDAAANSATYAAQGVDSIDGFIAAWQDQQAVVADDSREAAALASRAAAFTGYGDTVAEVAAGSARAWDDAGKLIADRTVATADQIAGASDKVNRAIDEVNGAARARWSDSADEWAKVGQAVPADIAGGMVDKSKEVLDAADRLIDLLKNGLSPAEQASRLAGEKYTKAVAAGMVSEIPGAKDAARQTAVAAIKVIEDAANGTPSTKGLDAIGKYYDSLLAGGMDDRAVAVTLAAGGVAADVVQKLTGYYPDFDAAGVAYDAHVASGIRSNDGAIATAADTATDPLQNNPAATWGTNVGSTWVDHVAASIRAGDYAIARAMQNAMRAGIADSPPKWGPLSDIDKSGESIGHVWIDGIVKSVTTGRGAVAGAMGRALSDSAIGAPVFAGYGRAGGVGPAPIVVQVYAGVGDAVAIGREVSEALRAYQRASGVEA